MLLSVTYFVQDALGHILAFHRQHSACRPHVCTPVISKKITYRSRQIKMPAPNRSIFTNWVLFLMPNLQWSYLMSYIREVLHPKLTHYTWNLWYTVQMVIGSTSKDCNTVLRYHSKYTTKAQCQKSYQQEHELCACFARLPSNLLLSSALCPSLIYMNTHQCNFPKKPRR